ESNKDAWRVLNIILQKQCKFKEAELASKSSRGLPRLRLSPSFQVP
ncbi:unnamed protein product, partial [marine sediment metagenome]